MALGIFILINSKGQENFIGIFFYGLLLLVMGLGFALFADKVVASQEKEKSLYKPNKYVIRQVILFLFLMFFYIMLCIFILDKYLKANKDISTLLIAEGIGLITIFIGLGILCFNSIKNRKNNKIHDKSFTNSKLHKNNHLFTMVIDYCWYEEGNMYFRGNIHGQIDLNDLVYFYFPLDKSYSAYINDIQIEGISKNSAKDERCTIVTETEKEITIPTYTICTSMIDYGKNDIERNVVNPEVLALINGINEQRKKEGFFDALINEIVHGKYLVKAVPIDKKKDIFNRIINYIFGYRGNYAFNMMANDKKEEAFPIYTDWGELNKALETVKDDEKEISEAMLLSFDEIQKMAMNTPYQSIIINPFGERYFLIYKDLLNDIINSKAYIEEFKK